MPNYAELMEAIERLETTTYGDASRDKRGLVERVNTLESNMTEIRDLMKKAMWLLFAGVIGAVLNLLFNAKNVALQYQSPQHMEAKK